MQRKKRMKGNAPKRPITFYITLGEMIRKIHPSRRVARQLQVVLTYPAPALPSWAAPDKFDYFLSHLPLS